jgi:glycopeptide antibiotics resistance protein
MILFDTLAATRPGVAPAGRAVARRRHVTSVSTRLLLIWFVCIVAGTMAPFNFGAPPLGREHANMFQYGPYERAPMDFALNLLLFVPFGALMHHVCRSRSMKLRWIAVVVGTGSVLISGTVEYLQAFLPLRNSSLIDVLANTGGALMGVAAARSWGTPLRARVHRLRAATSSTMLAGLMAGFLIVGLVISGALQAQTRLINWSAEFELLIGNERTGDRPWKGRVFALAMTDASTPLASVQRFSAGESVALPGAQIAAFDFKGSSPYRDASGNLPALEWTELPNASSNSGSGSPGRPWLRSAGPASELANRLRRTNAFTLRVRCATDDTHQDGPARIVTNSESPFARNFTLAQQGSGLVFRLRTPATGLNGYPLEVVVPGTFSDHHPREILVSYDGATLLVTMAHANEVSRTEITPGAGVALAIPSLNVRPHELQMYKLAYIALLSLVPGALIGLLGHTTRDRQLFGIGWVLAFPVLLEATLVVASGRAFDWGNVAVSAGVTAFVLTVCSMTLSLPDLRWRSVGASWLASQDVNC